MERKIEGKESIGNNELSMSDYNDNNGSLNEVVLY